jgi:hypothetical protein
MNIKKMMLLAMLVASTLSLGGCFWGPGWGPGDHGGYGNNGGGGGDYYHHDGYHGGGGHY